MFVILIIKIDFIYHISINIFIPFNRNNNSSILCINLKKVHSNMIYIVYLYECLRLLSMVSICNQHLKIFILTSY